MNVAVTMGIVGGSLVSAFDNMGLPLGYPSADDCDGSKPGVQSCCLACTAGTVSIGAQYQCSPCAPGFYSNAAATSCLECVAGKYSIGGATSCTDCLSDFFSAYTKQAACSSCLTCAAGRYQTVACTTTVDRACADCAAGKSGAGGANSLCTDCASGKYSAAAKSSWCATAGAGKYVNSARTVEFDCPSGTYSVGGVDVCYVCDPGSYSAVGAVGCTMCTTCAAGRYQTVACTTTVDRACADCAAGKSGAGGANSLCTDCASGKYSAAAKSSCTDHTYCGVGTYISISGTLIADSACTDCVAGKYSIGGATSCTDCLSEFFSAYTKQAACSSCLTCAAGRYQTVACTTTVDRACADCAAGKSGAGGANSLCTDCASGKYSAAAKSSWCATAGAGKYVESTRKAEVVCASGTYSVGGVDACTVCASGSYSAAGAVGCSACTICAPGQYETGVCSSTTDRTCADCVAGKASSGGANSCSDCSSGTYSSSSSAGYCTTVEAGYKANDKKTGSEICPVNTYSTGASDKCELCGDGHSREGASSCIACAPGKYFAPNADIKTYPDLCMLCVAGKYSASGASSMAGCIDCTAPGSYSLAGAAYCLTVGAGYSVISVTNRTGKVECPEDTYSAGASDSCTSCKIGKSLAGSTSPSSCSCAPGSTLVGTGCESCEVGKYKSSDGIKSCDLCDSDDSIKGSTTATTGATNEKDCQCPKRTFLLESGPEEKKVRTCEPVVKGMNTTTFNSTLADIPLLDGFWRIDVDTTDVRPCPIAGACLGGADPSEYCRVGHDGPYCNLCKAGYSKDVFGMCQECQTSTANIVGTGMTIVGLAVLAFAVSFLQKKLLRSEKGKSMFKAIAVGLKILFVTYQILATLPSIVPNLTLPANFSAMLISIQFTKLNLFQLVSVGCVATGFDFYSMLLSVTLLPLALIGILVMVGLKSSLLRTRCFTIALAISYVVLPTVTTVIFGAFPCDDFEYDGRTSSFLRADYSISCKSGQYKIFKLYAGIMLLLVPVGIPVTYFVVLWRRRSRIQLSVEEREKDEELSSVAFLFNSYKPQFWWFELFETCRRLALTGALGAIEPGTITQLAAGMLIAVFGIAGYCSAMPYVNMRDSMLQIMANFQILTVMLAALVLKYRPSAADKTDDRALGIFLILLNVLGATTLVCILIFKFVVPTTAEEEKTRSAWLVDAITGRKRPEKRIPSGNEVPQIEDGASIELGTIHKMMADGADEVKGSENPMRSSRIGTFVKK